jgi:hypothetical protein
MGDRANIVVEQTEGSVYLYTHWGGSGIRATLAAALDRGRPRWTDPAYLTRIIFSEMIQGDVLGGTGYGISTDHCEPGNDLWVDPYAQTVLDGRVSYTFEEFINYHHRGDKK